jgi:hypothetical protein
MTERGQVKRRDTPRRGAAKKDRESVFKEPWKSESEKRYSEESVGRANRVSDRRLQRETQVFVGMSVGCAALFESPPRGGRSAGGES